MTDFETSTREFPEPITKKEIKQFTSELGEVPHPVSTLAHETITRMRQDELLAAGHVTQEEVDHVGKVLEATKGMEQPK